MEKLICNVISEGVAYGNIVRINDDNLFVSDKKCENKDKEKEEARKALLSVTKDLKELKESCKDDFLDAHIMILEDPQLLKEIDEQIDSNSFEASKACDVVFNKYIEQFKSFDSDYLEERNLDFKDLRRRVLQTLNKDYVESLAHDKVIIVCEELYPSYLSDFRSNVAGVIAHKGGTTSHGAILCRAREIPFVLVDNIDIKNSLNCVIDTREKAVYVDCDLDFIQKYKDYKNSISLKVRIRDFSEQGIRILGNVSENKDLYKVRKYKLYGVGLYRTEFIFMNKSRALTEEEQYQIYNDAVLEMKQRPITFRTFDIGDDKQLSYLKASKKGVRNYRNYPELFKDQVVALIRANRYQNMKIMFPMIETEDEFRYLKDLVVKYKNELGNKSYLRIGMMLETKEALKNLSDFIDVDFISLGTNDLTHELYNINRNEVSNYKIYIDSLIKELEKVVDHCKRYNIELSICGELAGIPEVTNKLLDLGIRNFSVSSPLSKGIEASICKYYNLK